MPATDKRRPAFQFEESPTAWFAALERAISTRDVDLAAKAKSELHRLGVSVNFSRKKLVPNKFAESRLTRRE